jgi:hypothetical protein
MHKTHVWPILTVSVLVCAASEALAADEAAATTTVAPGGVTPDATEAATQPVPSNTPEAAMATSQAAAFPQANEASTAAATTPAANAPGATPAEDAQPVPSYFRVDHDYMFGLQLWAGATYPISDVIGIATDIYIAENYPTFSGGVDSAGGFSAGTTQSYWGEFDIGPTFTFGKLTLTPMVGIAFDWAAKRAVAINGPQLYTVFNHDKIYFESWVWTLLYSAMNKAGSNDYIHTRNWILYKINETIAVGPQLEYSYDLEAKSTIFGFPVGGHVELAYGSGNSLGLFLGYDTKRSTRGPDNTAAVGRLTFVHNF